jgi:hypothetical protein
MTLNQKIDEHFYRCALGAWQWALHNARRTDMDITKYIADCQAMAIAFASKGP